MHDGIDHGHARSPRTDCTTEGMVNEKGCLVPYDRRVPDSEIAVRGNDRRATVPVSGIASKKRTAHIGAGTTTDRYSAPSTAKISGSVSEEPCALYRHLGTQS